MFGYLQASEEERIQSTQQSTDVLISLETEVSSLREENAQLKQELSITTGSSALALELQLYKEQVEAEHAKELQDLRNKVTSSEQSLANALEKIKEMEEEFNSLGEKNAKSEPKRSDLPEMPLEGGMTGMAWMRGLLEDRDRKRKSSGHRPPPSLLETKIIEARHMQWSSTVHIRESATMFKQSERVGKVLDQMQRDMRQRQAGDRDVMGVSAGLTLHTEPLRKIQSDLENSFEASRSFAVTLDSRLESSRNTMYADILSAVEPEIEAIDEIYSSLDYSLLQSVNSTCSAINKSIRYRPGESKIHQEQSNDSVGGSFSCEYLYSIRNECFSLLPVVSQFVQTAAIKCAGLTVSYEPYMKSLNDIMDDCFLNYKGDYSLVCDLISCSVTVDSLEVLREFLAIIGSNDGERKRINLPGALSFTSPSASRFPRYALMAVKNKFNSNYDAISYSAGYRDLCLYLRFVESAHPLHVIEVRVELKAFVEKCGGTQGGWVSHLFKIARPLKIFDDPLRSHVGPIDTECAKSIKEGVTQAICLDHFAYSICGGDLLVASLSQSPYCAVQEISLHGCGISDNDLSILIAVLSIHKRLKSLRLSGERKDVRGQIREFPWDVIEMEVQNANRGRRSAGTIPGFSCVQSLDLSYNMIRGNFYPFISTILPGLRSLNFDDNSLSGHLPPDLGNLSSLQHLVLSRNEFSGPIPASIGCLTCLKDFQVWQNKLTGPIPSSISGLTNLLRMNIDSCMLTGPIPDEMGRLTALREFYCFDNRISGHLPPSLGGISNLQYLGLNGNQLSGPIPSEFGKLRKLKTLFLHENSLVGTIPAELGGLTDLRKMSLRGNRLQGKIPNQFSNLLNLQALALSENSFSGPIPRDITRLESLEAFSVANNKLSGTLPPGIGRMTSLRLLDITKNQISGVFPAEICSLTGLRDVLFAENFIEGNIPPAIGKLTELSSLELQGNRMNGPIPTVEIARMQSLRKLNLSRNHLVHGEAAQKHLSDRLQHCDVNVDSGQRPKAHYES